jgi:hypothetical protein
MTVRAGREFLAVPGPTNIPDEVLQAMHQPAVEIYSEPLIALTDSLAPAFRQGRRDQGHSRRPGRYQLERVQRHRGDRQRHQGRTA